VILTSPHHPFPLTFIQVRPGRGINEIKEIARTTGNLILGRNGVVRGITNWGTFLLPKPARKQGALYNQGHYFILRFDSDGRTQHAVRRTLGLDPRMIRYSVVKMGSKLEEIADVGGKAEWESKRAGGEL
jgi:small subunit ribosomal protein S6